MNILLKSVAIVSSLIAGLQAAEQTMDVESGELNQESCLFPEEMTNLILGHTSTEQILDLKSEVCFEDAFGNLRLVCKDWQIIIDNHINSDNQGNSWKENKKSHSIKSLISAYKTIGYGNICEIFLKGKLFYTPNKGIPIPLLIADLEKPFAGEFNLLKCGDASKCVSISTGYRKEKIDKNKDKTEIWITPQFVIKNEFAGNEKYFERMLYEWDGIKAPIGIFWTVGYWKDLCEFTCLTEKGIDYISTNSLLTLWQCDYTGYWAKIEPKPASWEETKSLKKFNINFVNQN